MENNTIKMSGYHGTCSVHMNSIEKNGFDPSLVHIRKDHWLGQGVYFFSELPIAMWWASDISGKSANKGSFPIVYQVEIEAAPKEVLDLDDYVQCDLFLTRILQVQAEIEKDIKGRYPIFNEAQFRAVYFDYYKQTYGISVIIYTFNKPYIRYGTWRNENERMRQEKLIKALRLYYHEKQICVSEKECIKNIEIIYNGEDEVI